MSDTPLSDTEAGNGPPSSEERVLVLAPTGGDARLAHAALAGSGLTVQVCQRIEEVCLSVESGAGAVVIAQESLTPSALNLLNTAFSRQPPWSDLPVLVLTRARRHAKLGESSLLSLEALRNATFLERPLRTTTLVQAVRSALASRRRQYEIREYLHERQRAAAERVVLLEMQRAFLRDVLASVTEGKLRLCDGYRDLPPRLVCPDEPVTLTPQSLRLMRAHVAQAAETAGHCLEWRQDLIMASSEAAMNAVTHAGGGKASVGSASSGMVQVWIEDQGGGIDVERLPRATLERGFSSAGTLGHGFWLILQTVDRIWLLTSAGGTTIVLEKDREQSEPSWFAMSP